MLEAGFFLFPFLPPQILIDRLSNVVHHGYPRVVREPLERGDLPCEQIWGVTIYRIFLGRHSMILPATGHRRPDYPRQAVLRR